LQGGWEGMMEVNTATAWAPTGMQRAGVVYLARTKAPVRLKKAPFQGLIAYKWGCADVKSQLE